VTPTRSSSTSPNDATLRERPHQRPARGRNEPPGLRHSDPIVICTEHRSVKKRCKCGTVSAGAFPREARAPVSYGPNVRAAALYLLHAQHCSVERTAQALSEMLGRRSRPASSLPWPKRPREDSTLSWPRSPKLSSLRRSSMSTRHLTKSAPTPCGSTSARQISTRSCTRARRAAKLPPTPLACSGASPGTMVHDRLQMYFNYTGATHAICLAHVLRDLEAAGVRWNQGWAVEMATLLAETNKACHEARAAARSASAQESSPPSCPLTTPSSAPAWPSTPTRWGASGTTSRRSPTTLPSRCETVAAKRPSSPETSPFLSPTTRPSPRSEWPSSTEKISAASRRRLGPTLRGDSAPTSPPRGSTASALSTSSPALLRRRLDATGDNLSTPTVRTSSERDPQARAIHRCVPYVRDLNVCNQEEHVCNFQLASGVVSWRGCG